MQNQFIKDIVNESLFTDEQKINIASYLSRIRQNNKISPNSFDFINYKSELESIVIYINDIFSPFIASNSEFQFIIYSLNTFYTILNQQNYLSLQPCINSILVMFL
jgi:hypothetical protein